MVDIGSRHYDSDKLARPASTAERRADRIPTKRQEQRALCRGKSDLGRGSVTRISSGHDGEHVYDRDWPLRAGVLTRLPAAIGFACF